MKKRFAVLISLFSLVVLFLTGCDNKPKENVVAENVGVSIIYETRYLTELNTTNTFYFDGEKIRENPQYHWGQAEQVKVDKLIQCEGYFKVIIGDKTFIFSNNVYSYRIIPNGSN